MQRTRNYICTPVKDDAKALLDYSKKVGSETDFLSFGPEG